MKKLNLAVVLISSFLFSCGNSTEQNIKTAKVQPENIGRVVYKYGWNKTVRVFEVDSCEYVAFDAGSTDGGVSITHKHNCKFCAKR